MILRKFKGSEFIKVGKISRIEGRLEADVG